MRPLLKILMLTAMMIAAGCAKDSGGGSPVQTCVGRCDGSDTIGTGETGTGTDINVTGYTGSTTSLSYIPGFGDFFFMSRPQRPTNIRLNIDFGRPDSTIIVSYVEGMTGRLVEAAQGTVHPYSGISNEQYNRWYTVGNRSVYKGFFQDQYGAIIVIVNRTTSQGDGQAGQFVGGEIWYQNFAQGPQYAPDQGPLKMCWQITIGPYDCRSFLTGSYNHYSVSMTSSTLPTSVRQDNPNPYRKLLEFDGINPTAANFPTN